MRSSRHAAHNGRFFWAFAASEIGHTFPSPTPIVLNEINPGGLERSADGRFIREGNWDRRCR